MLLFKVKKKKKKKVTENKNTRVLKTKNDNTMMILKCEICSRKKSKFIKKQEASEILSN